MAGVLRSVFDVVDYVGARSLYGEMSLESQFFAMLKRCFLKDIVDAKTVCLHVHGSKLPEIFLCVSFGVDQWSQFRDGLSLH